jgi:hypothetical protein
MRCSELLIVVREDLVKPALAILLVVLTMTTL